MSQLDLSEQTYTLPVAIIRDTDHFVIEIDDEAMYEYVDFPPDEIIKLLPNLSSMKVDDIFNTWAVLGFDLDPYDPGSRWEPPTDAELSLCSTEAGSLTEIIERLTKDHTTALEEHIMEQISEYESDDDPRY